MKAMKSLPKSRNIDHVCCDCGKILPKRQPCETSCTTGYGRTNSGKYICYDCCALRDQRHMKRTGKTTMYLTFDTKMVPSLHGRTSLCRSNARVTNWPGTLKFNCRMLSGAHNFAGIAYHVWFTDGNKQRWYGRCVGNNTQLTHCRRIKS